MDDAALTAPPVEEWRTCADFPQYMVSSLGQVWSKPRRRTKGGILKAHKDRKGYRYVTLYDGSRTRSQRIARLVALAFIGACPPGHECAHLNGDPADDRPGNLQWVPPKINQVHRKIHGTAFGQHSGAVKLTPAQALSIHADTRPPTVVAAEHRVSIRTIKNIKTGETWAQVTGQAPLTPTAAEVQARFRAADKVRTALESYRAYTETNDG